MEWTDTLMLESSRLEANADEAKSSDCGREKPPLAISGRIFSVQGISILHANGQTDGEATAALELLRGFRATGRRVAMCDASTFTANRQLGGELVQRGGAEMLVSFGRNGRELAIGARDVGLDLGSVVVCSSAASGCDVLSRRLQPGDTVLLWGVDQQTCDRLVSLLDQRLSERAAIAA